MTTEINIDTFTQAYIEAALWSSTYETEDREDNPMDDGAHELAEETRAKMIADCQQFQAENAELITDENLKYGPVASREHEGMYSAEERAGHDFWLTRCGHGAGFWDGDWNEPAATKLTEASKRFGNVDLYIGDDGLIYS